MTPPLFLLDDIPDGGVVHLSGDEGHHAAKVKRVRAGEAVLVADGRGTLLRCTVRTVLPDGVLLAVTSRELVAEGQPRLVVVQALPKGERAELAVEIMTELGVDEIVPWAASRCVTQWHGARGEKALARWRRTAAEAAKQSRRPRTPALGALASSADVAARLARAACAAVLHEDAVDAVATMAVPLVGELVLVVGPEGGVAPEELDAFAAAGARTVRLGPTVLRTSTAGAAAVAALSPRLGRWS
ncbi:16S rRNA (uracil1498-N3)-methyltransferase [Jatrophihabitans endophyticus]|uniref:Ribosomal RNA small subunit methyltransferase E n=1 Tax=Jatrophihabitans endophyticus TaxID=1206085 RepID=A0A1M5KFZ8_9ACTN|nr:16S rRNA (uracil(1498)-N(3))-methyltransferase [Jatrophihabitans endophyticus]SHG51103.1 16S rRNA (uracil1498-N3)-methyltransferase [Jatrophihabitans endophyticus]